jgi:arylsulfatase A-like enzyme
MIRHPTRYSPGVRDSSMVQLYDLFETIQSAAGVEGRFRSEGADLLAGVPETRPVFLEYYAPLTFLEAWGWGDLPQLDPLKRRLRAVRSQNLKLILGSDGSKELYDVARDPLELEDLSGRAEYAAELMRLQALLQGRFANCEESPAVESAQIELDERTLRELRSLGYIP